MTAREIACALVLASPMWAAAHPRPCLDLTADEQVDIADVVRAYRIAAAIDPIIDLRADVDDDGIVDIADTVGLLLVATGRRPGNLGLEPPAVAPGRRVTLRAANIGDDVPLAVRVGRNGPRVEARREGASVTFLMPDVGRLAEPVPVVLLRGDEPSNACRVRVLAPGQSDEDGDGLVGADDTCPAAFDPVNSDTDEDGLGDVCDNCPATPNPDQRDGNGDGAGDACSAPEDLRVRGRPVPPGAGVEAALAEAGVPDPHFVLVAERGLDDALRADLVARGVTLVEVLGLHAHIARAPMAAIRQLADAPWFRAALAVTPEQRLAGFGGVPPPPQAVVEVDVSLYADLTLDEAEAVLRGEGLRVIRRGVEMRGADMQVRRLNHWGVEGPGRAVADLARHNRVDRIAPTAEAVLDNADSRGAMRVDALHRRGSDGAGIVIGQWDGGAVNGDGDGTPMIPRPPHPALDGRVRIRDHGDDEGIPMPDGCGSFVSCAGPGACMFGNVTGVRHATHVAGTMIGDGTLLGGRGVGAQAGMAPAAELVSYAMSSDPVRMVCQRQDATANFGTVVHNNSWSARPASDCSNVGEYTAFTEEVDAFSRSNESTDVFTAGNQQSIRHLAAGCTTSPNYSPQSCTPPPAHAAPLIAQAPPDAATQARFFTVVGPGAAAKNAVIVGNIDVTDIDGRRPSASSSIGPTADLRLEPEVVAHGTGVTSTCFDCPDGYESRSGTSMAAPGVSGVIALLYARAAELNIDLRADTVRALLAHTAIDLGVHTGPGGAFMALQPRMGSQCALDRDCEIQEACVDGVCAAWPTFGAPDGPDYVTGYGLVDGFAAHEKLNEGNPIKGLLKPTGCPDALEFASVPIDSPVQVNGPGPVPGCPPMIWDVVWYLEIPPDQERLKITIAWSDPPGEALVNDLDLVLQSPDGKGYRPWFLDPHCPHLPARKVECDGCGWPGRNQPHDTLEQIVVDARPGQTLPAGRWRLIVRASGAQGAQPFSMLIDLD